MDKRSLIKNSAIYIFADALNKAVPFLVLPFFTYYLIPEEYGIISNFSVYTNFLSIFIGLNLASYIQVKFFEFDKVELARSITNIFVLMLVTAISCAFIIIIFLERIKLFLPINILFIMTGVLVSFFQSISIINLSLWRLKELPLYFGAYQVNETILSISISAILIVSYNFGSDGRLIGICISASLFGLFSIYYLIKRGYLILDNPFSLCKAKEMLNFGLPLVPHSISIWVRSGIDRFIITFLYGAAATGIYAAGFQFGLLISFLTLAFNNAYVPFLYKRLSEADRDKLLENKIQIVRFTYIYTMVLFLLSGLLIVVCNYLIVKFLSSKYSDSIQYIPWVMLGNFFQGVYLIFVSYIFYTRKTRIIGWISTSCSLIQVGTSYILVHKYGPIGASYSYCIVSILNGLLVIYYSTKVYSMPWMRSLLLWNRRTA